MAFEAKISIKGVQEAIAELNKLGPAGENAAKKLQAALNKGDMGKGLEKLGEAASTVFEKIGAGMGALTGSSFGEGGKLFDEVATHAVTAGKALVGVFSSIRSGGSEASEGLKSVGSAAATAGQAAAAGGSGFARVIGSIAGFATVAVGVVTAVAAAAVAVGVLTYKANQAGAEILDLQYAAGATAEDVQRMGAAADKAGIPFKAMAEIAAHVRSGFREASLAADSVVESWEVMQERVSTAAEAVSIAETEQAEAAIASAEKIKEAEKEKADAAEESAQQRVDAAHKVADAQHSVEEAQYNVEKAERHEGEMVRDQVRSENDERRSERRSAEDFKDRRDDLAERYASGKISTKDFEKDKKKIDRDEQRAKEDQAERRQELAEKRAEMQRELESHHQLVEAENNLQKAMENLQKAIEAQHKEARKAEEQREKIDQKLADENRKQGEEAEKGQKTVDRAHTMQDRIAAGRDEFARQAEVNSPPMLRLFSGFKNIGDEGGIEAYKNAKAKLREISKYENDTDQENAMFAERDKYIAAHGGVVDQNIKRFDEDIAGGSARLYAQGAESFRAPIDEINKENAANGFPSTDTLNAEGRGAQFQQRVQTHLEDKLVHGGGGTISKFFDRLRGKEEEPPEQERSKSEPKGFEQQNQDGSVATGAKDAGKALEDVKPPAEHAGKSLEDIKPKAEQAGSALGELGNKAGPAGEAMGNIGRASGAIEQLANAANKAAEALSKCGCEGGDASEEGAGHAAGGLISGPGTGTSDSIPANLSHGEYVVNAATVSRLGVPFMHALNSGKGFSTGGLVGAFESASGYHREARRFASGGLADASGGGHSVSFVLDGKTFGGFSGGKGAVEALSRHAVMQQVGAIGRRPSHAR
jgi:hypothetical protein